MGEQVQLPNAVSTSGRLALNGPEFDGRYGVAFSPMPSECEARQPLSAPTSATWNRWSRQALCSPQAPEAGPSGACAETARMCELLAFPSEGGPRFRITVRSDHSHCLCRC